MAVVVLRVVGRVSNDGAKAKAESEEDLRGSLPPHLNVCPNFQLCKREQERGVSVKSWKPRSTGTFPCSTEFYLFAPLDRTCRRFPLKPPPAGVLGRESRKAPRRGRWRRSTLPSKSGVMITLFDFLPGLFGGNFCNDTQTATEI